MPKTVKRVVLAYSGGLDTSVILRWLIETYRCEVVAYCADLGQGEELIPVKEKALRTGASTVHIVDLREEFVRDFVFPMLRANAVYEGSYLLGTSIARPLIAKAQVDVARKESADAVSHGATGKGNDQVRFELTYAALAPDLTVIAPWREWDLNSRTALMEFARRHDIPVPVDRGAAVLDGPQPVPHLVRGRHPRGSVERAPAQDVPAHQFAGVGARCAGVRRARLRGGQPGGGGRPPPLARGAARDGQPAGRGARHRPGGPGGEPVRGHEVARGLRGPPGAPSCTRPTGRSSRSRWTARSCTCATPWCPATRR